MVDSGEKPDQPSHERDNTQKHPSKKSAECEKHQPANAEKSTHPMTISTLVNLLFTAAIVICTIFLVISSFLTLGAICVQTFIYNAQLKEMEKSTNAATKAAKAAEASVEQARQSLHLDQRAWVAVGTVKGIPILDQILNVEVVCKNSGKTFAKKFTMHAVFDPRQKGEQPDFESETQAAIAKDSPGGVALLPPNAEFILPMRIQRTGQGAQTTSDDLKNIAEGKLIMFAYGKMTYEDIFGCPHWSTFCFRLSPTLKWFVNETYNDSDDGDCMPAVR